MSNEPKYSAIGFTTFPSGDPETNIHLIWAFDEAGREALGVAYVPTAVPVEQLKPGLAAGVQQSPERLFSCAGVLNMPPLQCTGPYSVTVGDEQLTFFVVNWCIEKHMRAFLVLGALDCEHAIRPFHNWWLKEQEKKTVGTHLIVSDTIQLVVELEDIGLGALRPNNDFEFHRVSSTSVPF